MDTHVPINLETETGLRGGSDQPVLHPFRLLWEGAPVLAVSGGGDQNEAWLLSGFLTLGKSAHLSEPQFPGLWSGDKHVWGGKSDSSLDKC